VGRAAGIARRKVVDKFAISIALAFLAIFSEKRDETRTQVAADVLHDDRDAVHIAVE